MSISCRQLYTTASRQICQGQFSLPHLFEFCRHQEIICRENEGISPSNFGLRIATPVCGLVRNDMYILVVLRCSKNENQPYHIIQKNKNTQDYHVLGTSYLELLARFELATRFPRNRGFVEALRPRIEIMSAYADRADEAASSLNRSYKK